MGLNTIEVRAGASAESAYAFSDGYVGLNGVTSFCQMVCRLFGSFILAVLQYEDAWQHTLYPRSIPQSVICAFAHRCCDIA